VSGFQAQNGGFNTSILQSNDQIIQNLFNLILNEQTAKLHLQNLVTTMHNKIDMLEITQSKFQKKSEATLNQTANDISTRLNAMNARLFKLEQIKATVSRQLTKEKNNIVHLDQMYAALEKHVTTDFNPSELRDVKSKLASMENLYTGTVNNLAVVCSRLGNLSTQFDRTMSEANETKLTHGLKSTYLHDKVDKLETRLLNITHQFSGMQIDSRLTGLTTMQEKLNAVELHLQNITKYTNVTHLKSVSNELTYMRKVLKNWTVKGLGKSRK
jgi:hypothetical protein